MGTANYPTPPDILLVIEVAETTLQYDRHVKIPLYGRAGIPEALIFNLPDEQLEYYSQPAEGYQEHRILKRGEQFTSAAAAGLSLDVNTILG